MLQASAKAVTADVAFCKLLHQPIDLLGCPRQPEPLQEG